MLRSPVGLVICALTARSTGRMHLRQGSQLKSLGSTSTTRAEQAEGGNRASTSRSIRSGTSAGVAGASNSWSNRSGRVQRDGRYLLQRVPTSLAALQGKHDCVHCGAKKLQYKTPNLCCSGGQVGWHQGIQKIGVTTPTGPTQLCTSVISVSPFCFADADDLLFTDHTASVRPTNNPNFVSPGSIIVIRCKYALLMIHFCYSLIGYFNNIFLMCTLS